MLYSINFWAVIEIIREEILFFQQSKNSKSITQVPHLDLKILTVNDVFMKIDAKLIILKPMSCMLVIFEKFDSLEPKSSKRAQLLLEVYRNFIGEMKLKLLCVESCFTRLISTYNRVDRFLILETCSYDGVR